MDIKNWALAHKNDLLIGTGIGCLLGAVVEAALKTKSNIMKGEPLLNDSIDNNAYTQPTTRTEKLINTAKTYAPSIALSLTGTALILKGVSNIKEDASNTLAAAAGAMYVLNKFKSNAEAKLGPVQAAVVERETLKEVWNEEHEFGIERSDFALFFGPDYSEIASGDGFLDFNTLKDIERYGNKVLGRTGRVTIVDVLSWLKIVDYESIYDCKKLEKFGWTYGDTIDFGLFCSSKLAEQQYIEYVNNLNDTVLLTFNAHKL